uniref:Uncharacterized protein n=1 Tax=Tetranychus urticae TaxID=32264 RepID=T1KDN6_TETUR
MIKEKNGFKMPDNYKGLNHHGVNNLDQCSTINTIQIIRIKFCND